MIPLASILKMHEKDFIQRYQRKLLPSHLKAIAAIKNCRSIYSPKMLMQCADKMCHHQTLVPHSCGHRHCPHCQNHETQKWIGKQLQKQVPADYFMLTFTLPKQLRGLAWHKQRCFYTIMFESVWQTLRLFFFNDRSLGGVPGAIAVLHTHYRELNFHPHIHMVLPAAAIDIKRRLWRKKGKYLFNHKALAKVFRAKMLQAISVNGFKIPAHNPQKWVVDCLHLGKGEKALIYLGQYLYRGVIKEKDILSCQDGKVTFRYKCSKTKRYKTRTLAAVHFLWLVFQHILPRGFRRTRNFGFPHPNSKKMITILQWVFRFKPIKLLAPIKRKRMICARCRDRVYEIVLLFFYMVCSRAKNKCGFNMGIVVPKYERASVIMSTPIYFLNAFFIRLHL